MKAGLLLLLLPLNHHPSTAHVSAEERRAGEVGNEQKNWSKRQKEAEWRLHNAEPRLDPPFDSIRTF